jgi:hypothetical protein
MNQKQLEMIARGLRHARPMMTMDVDNLTSQARGALIVWCNCCIEVADQIATQHPRFNQQAFIKGLCGVPGPYTQDARTSVRKL